MIYDNIENIERYKGIYPNLDKAIEFIKSNNLKLLPNGRNEIIGDDIFINVIDSKLIEIDDGVYEYHRQYIDLHLDLDGTERMSIASDNSARITQEYSEDADFGLAQGDSCITCSLDERYFCICMINEFLTSRNFTTQSRVAGVHICMCTSGANYFTPVFVSKISTRTGSIASCSLT